MNMEIDEALVRTAQSALERIARKNSFYFPSNPVKAHELTRKLLDDPNFPSFWKYINYQCNTHDKFLGLAAKIAVSSDVTTKELVLFSTTLENAILAETYVNNNPRADFLKTTPCGLMLSWLGIGEYERSVPYPKLSRLFMYGASYRLARSTEAENVSAFVDGAAPDSTFRMLETFGIEKNPKVISINGDPPSDFASQWKSLLLSDWITNYLNQGRESDSPLTESFNRFARPIYHDLSPIEQQTLVAHFYFNIFSDAFPNQSPSIWTNREQSLICNAL